MGNDAGVVLNETQQDKIRWKLTVHGEYTAGSAYIMQFEGAAKSLTADLTWKTKAPPKCKFFSMAGTTRPNLDGTKVAAPWVAK